MSREKPMRPGSRREKKWLRIALRQAIEDARKQRIWKPAHFVVLSMMRKADYPTCEDGWLFRDAFRDAFQDLESEE